MFPIESIVFGLNLCELHIGIYLVHLAGWLVGPPTLGQAMPRVKLPSPRAANRGHSTAWAC